MKYSHRIKNYILIELNNDWSIAFEKFNKNAKKVSNVYKTGIRNWNSDTHYTYSLVLGTFRIMIYKDNHCLNQFT